ncbi:MAG: hypothetical protein ACRD0E_11135, partial [Acidimicrobiales bacterium]
MSISFNKTFQSGTAFTPASSSDALLAMLFDGGGNNISLSLSSTSGTYLIFNPPGPYNDDQTDSWAFLYQYNASAVSQTVTASGATGAFCFGLDYTGVASATIAVTETTNAGGSGAIQGAPVTVPTGSTLVAVCLRLNSGSDTISSPSGVNKFAGTTSWGTPACVTEYAGAGSSITPSFTSSGLVHYLVVQFVLTPSSAGPFISSVAPDPAVEGATGVVATGATLTGATLEIEQGSVGVSQTVTATTATTATYTVVMEPGSGVQLAYTDTVYPTSLVATAAGVNSNSFSVALEPVAGILFETLASIFATIADRLEATGPSSPLLVQDPAGTSQASSTTIAATLNGVTSGNTIVAILGCDSGPATLSSIHDSNGTVTAASAYGGAGSHP